MADLDHDTEAFAAEINKAVDRGAAKVDGFKPRLDANSRLNAVPSTGPSITDDFNKLIARHEAVIVYLKTIRDTL